ncbi:MAG: hypothetical protein H6917_05385 [Novosphingobium sp.]|nr:hypothetical protein [Novosphingobium sp.]MCP5401804.1 hypothetical protein [Novosphingobium sp.]
MRRWVVAMLSLAMVSGTALAQDRGPPGGRPGPNGPPGRERLNSYANPSALIAAEIALNQLTQEEGLWTSLRETAATGAILLMPEEVDALAWLKDRPDVAPLVDRDPDAVWMSCDGSYGVVLGGWTTDEASGHYASVWQRQEDGGYKWLIRHRIGQDGPVAVPEMITARIADCDRPRPESGNTPGRPQPAPAQVKAQSGYSADRTLFWRSGRDAAGVLRLLVRIRKDGQMLSVLGDELDQPAGS